MTAGYPVHDEPPDVQHAGVVVDVEKCDLVIVFPQYEEKGVHELDQLGEVVPPQDTYDLMAQKIKRLIKSQNKNKETIVFLQTDLGSEQSQMNTCFKACIHGLVLSISFLTLMIA